MKKVLLIAVAFSLAEIAIAQDEIVYYPNDSKRSTPEQFYDGGLLSDDGVLYLDEYTATPEKQASKKKTQKKQLSLSEGRNRFAGLTDPEDPRTVWYSGMADVGFGSNTNTDKFTSSLSTTHGLHFTQWFFMGIGVGYLYERDGTYFPSYQIPNATYISKNNDHGHIRGGYWDDRTEERGGYDVDCHSFNYFLDMRAYIAKCKWVIPYVDVKLGGMTSIVWHEGSWAQWTAPPTRDTYTGERVTKTIGYRAHPNKADQTGFYYELGVGAVIARYFDVRFAFGSGNDMLAPVNLQFKIGARF